MGKGIGWYTPLKEGGSIGDIYITDFQRDAQGNVIVDKSSRLSILHTTMCMQVIIDPKYTMGLANSFYGKALNSIL